MKFSIGCIRKIVKESMREDRLVAERPWSIEVEFKLSGGKAADSEGVSPDGFQIMLRDEDGNEASVVVDTYWNPQAGDTSGNQMYAVVNGQRVGSTYVPTRFDDGKSQTIVVSNSPSLGAIVVSHARKGEAPVAYLAFGAQLALNSSVEVTCEPLGDSEKLDCKVTNRTNL